MIPIKTKEEIQIMREGGKILGESLSEVLKAVKPGVTELELDKLAEELIIKKGGVPGFKKVKGYNHSTCFSTNNVVVHGVPSDYKLKAGDLVGIDCGVFFKGFHTDMSHSIIVKDSVSDKPDKKLEDFLKTGEKALHEAIDQAIVDNRIGDISQAIQAIVEGSSYSVVQSLIGHGVGKQLHEEPEIPGYLAEDMEKTPLIKEGMTLAIEVIYNMGKADVVYAKDDGWTISTKDGSVSGLYERTVAILDSGPEILTKLSI